MRVHHSFGFLYLPSLYISFLMLHFMENVMESVLIPYEDTSVNAELFLKIRLKFLRSFKPLVIDLVIDRLSL